MADEVQAGETPEQTAAAVNAEQGAAPGNAEQEARQPEYVTAGEFKRRFGRLEDQLNTAIQYMAVARQPAQQAPQQRSAAPTDEELWSQAQQGDRLAFEEYQGRIAERKIAQARAAQTGNELVTGRLNALRAKYPVLDDGSHPLTQVMNSNLQSLLAAGYPRNQATLLEAANMAITDRPDLVSDLYSQGARANEHSRQSATRSAQSGMTTGSPRQEPIRQGNVRELSDKEMDLARRMGLTPEKAKGAKERFLKRQQQGLSTIDPRMIPVVERMAEDF